MSQDVSYGASGKNADQSRENKAMVDDEFPDMRSARAVELNRRKIARIGRKDIISVASRRKRDNQTRIDIDGDCERNESRDSRSLGI